MADVYLACTQGPGGFQKLLVVKLARFIGDAMFSTMFLDEARLAAQLSHPHVVQTFEVGEEGSRHYIVMEYLDGANFARLRQRAGKRGGIPLRISLAVLAQVLEGLDYAHNARGIDGKLLRVVHRDLTPSNIIITAQGVAKILDFGIAKGADTHSFTQTGRYSGKLNYMPPEQVRGERVDSRADIFSCGVILVEAALGERFWGTSTGPAVAARLGQGQLPELEGSSLDPEMRRICERALTPNREDRYPTAAAFRADLVRYINSHGGPVDREELASYVCEMVADDRERLQAVIDTQLQRLSQLSFGPYAPPDLPRLEITPNRQFANDPTAKLEMQEDVEIVRMDQQQLTPAQLTPSQLTPSNVTPLPQYQTGPISMQQPAALPAPATRSRMSRFTIGAGLAVGGGVLIAMLAHRSPSAAAPAPAPTPSPAPAAAPVVPPVAQTPTPAPAAPAPTTIRLEVIVSPAEATLVLDGKSLGTNPYVGVLPHDSQIHELDVRADGYIPAAKRFVADSDLMLQLHLDPQKQTEPAPVAREREREHEREPVVHTPVHAPQHVASHPVSHPTPAAAPATPATPPPATTTAAATTATATPSSDPNKRAIDSDVYDSKGNKRSLDGNVYDDSKKTQPIDRDNPWKK